MDNIQETEKLSEEQVNQVLNAFDFLEFSNSYKSSYYNTYFTPDAVNQQMQSINMMPAEATVKKLEQALSNVKSSEQILRNYSADFENKNMYYKRLISYFTGLPCFNITFDCINIEKDSDFNSKEYKEDLKIVDEFLSRFNYKSEFQTVLRQLFRQGAFYGILRPDGNKYTIQELPADFCRITGRHSYGLLFDFNMQWFTGSYGVDIDMYPSVFKKLFRRVFRHSSKQYDPATDVDKRNSGYAYWQQTSPVDGFWAWKINPNLATEIPYFAPLFPDLALQPIIRGLQEDKYFIEASKLLVGIIGMNKDNKSGNVANATNITPDLLGKFLGTARKGLRKQIGLTALPMDSIETVEFDTTERNLYTDYLKNVTDQSVAASAVLLDNNKLIAHQSKLASAVDMNLIKELYPMFANFIAYYVNSATSKFKFTFKFNDFNTPDNLLERKEVLDKFNSMGAINWEMMARFNDKSVFEYKRQILSEKSMFKDITDNFALIAKEEVKAPNGAGGAPAGKVGRPPAINSDNDNTVASQDNESNER